MTGFATGCCAFAGSRRLTVVSLKHEEDKSECGGDGQFVLKNADCDSAIEVGAKDADAEPAVSFQSIRGGVSVDVSPAAGDDGDHGSNKSDELF